MDALNHAITIADQTHAQLTLLAGHQYDALSGSPTEVARRLAVNVESMRSAMKIARRHVRLTAEAMRRSLRLIDDQSSESGEGGMPPTHTPIMSIVTCETASPPPHVRPTVGPVRDDVKSEIGFSSFGPSEFQPKRESDRGPQQAMRQQRPETREGLDPKANFRPKDIG